MSFAIARNDATVVRLLLRYLSDTYLTPCTGGIVSVGKLLGPLPRNADSALDAEVFRFLGTHNTKCLRKEFLIIA